MAERVHGEVPPGKRIGRTLCGVAVPLAAAAAVLVFLYWLGGTQTGALNGYGGQILRRLGVDRYGEKAYFGNVILYLLFAPAALNGYWLLVLRPRREGPRTGRQTAAVAGFMAALVALALLGVPAVFESVVPHASSANDGAITLYMILLALHAVLAAAGAAGILATERHCARQHNAPRRPLREARRYGVCLALLLPVRLCTDSIIVLRGNGFASRGYVPQAESVAACIALVLLAPPVEECLFRGMLFGRLARHIPAWAAAILSAVCFGVWHMDEVAFLYTLVPGLAYAALCARSGRLRYGILAHALNNLLPMLMGSPQNSVLPALPFLVRWQDRILLLTEPTCAAMLAGSLAVIALLVWKAFPGTDQPALHN